MALIWVSAHWEHLIAQDPCRLRDLLQSLLVIDSHGRRRSLKDLFWAHTLNFAS